MSTYTKLDSYKSTCCNALLWKMQKQATPACSKCGRGHDVTFPASAKRRNHMLIMGLPEVRGILGRYEVPERKGFWVVVKKYSREVDPRGKDRLPDGHVYGIEGCTILHLRPQGDSK